MVQIRLLVDGIDRSSILMDDPEDTTWELDLNARGEIDIATFTLDDKDKTLDLNSGKQVIFEKFSDAGVRYFGGVITEIADTTEGIGRRFHCKALGWTFDLQRTVVDFIYRGQSDQFIITDPTDGVFGANGPGKAVQKDLSAYTATIATVEVGIANTNRVVIHGQTVRDMMDMFSGWSGYVWGVTPLQVLYYRAKTSESNVGGLSDSPDDIFTFPYYGLRRFRNFSEIVNKVYVYGGRFTKKDQTIEYENTSSIKVSFITPQEWRSADSQTDQKVVVEKNTGTDGSPVWAVQTVGTPEEVGTFDVRWHELTREFEFTTAPLIREKAFRVTGDIFDHLFWEEDDPISIVANGQYDLTIRDSTLRDEDAVELRARAELLKRAAAGERVTLNTTVDDYEVGKLVVLTNTVRGISGVNYLVNKMTMTGLGGAETEYELTLENVPA